MKGRTVASVMSVVVTSLTVAVFGMAGNWAGVAVIAVAGIMLALYTIADAIDNLR